MKKGVIVAVIVALFILSSVGFFLFKQSSYKSSENISCSDYNSNQEACFFHSECEWITEENLCNSVFAVENDKENNEGGNSEEKDDLGRFCPDYDNNQQECLLHSECVWVSKENLCDSINEKDDNGKLILELESIEILDSFSNKLCKQIPLSDQLPYNERYQCLAIVNHDERFCEGIDETNENLMCLAFANKDSSYCEKLQKQEAKHTCYYMLAVSSKNASFCSEIDYNQNEKEQCYYNFISNLYQWEKSDEIKTEYCEQLSSPDDNTCLALKARDVNMCGSNPNCLTHFEQSLSFCDKHPDISRSSCIKDRAKTNKNVSICELLSQPDRDSCIGVYCTHIDLDVNVCDKIEDPKKKQEVYKELAMFLSNW